MESEKKEKQKLESELQRCKEELADLKTELEIWKIAPKDVIQGNWEYRRADGTESFTIDRVFFNIFQHDISSDFDLEGFFKRIHPSDREKAKHDFHNHLVNPQDFPVFWSEVRFMVPPESYHWFLIWGKAPKSVKQSEQLVFKGKFLDINGSRSKEKEVLLNKKKLEALTNLALDLSNEANMEGKLSEIAEKCKNVFHTDVVTIVLDDRTGGRKVAVTEGAWTDAYRNMIVPKDIGLGALVITEGKGYISNNYFEDYNFEHSDYTDEIWKEENFKSCMVVPMKLGNDIIGRLWAISRSETYFTEHDLKMLEHFAQLSSLSILRYKIYKLLGDSHELATKITVDEDIESILDYIVESVKDLIETDLVHIGLYDKDEKVIKMTYCPWGETPEFRSLAIAEGDGMGAKAFEKGDLVICEDYLEEYGSEISPKLKEICKKEGIVSGMAMPLMVEGRRLGVLWAFNKKESHFLPFDETVMRTLGDLAAVEIDKHTSLQSLFNIITDTPFKNDIEQILKFLHTSVKEILFPDEVIVSYGNPSNSITINFDGSLAEQSTENSNRMQECLTRWQNYYSATSPAGSSNQRDTDFSSYKCHSSCLSMSDDSSWTCRGYPLPSDEIGHNRELICISWPQSLDLSYRKESLMDMVIKVAATEIARRRSLSYIRWDAKTSDLFYNLALRIMK